MLSWTHLRVYIEPFDGDYLSPAALDRAVELAEAAPRALRKHNNYPITNLCFIYDNSYFATFFTRKSHDSPQLAHTCRLARCTKWVG
jgi:hypothetical protein